MFYNIIVMIIICSFILCLSWRRTCWTHLKFFGQPFYNLITHHVPQIHACRASAYSNYTTVPLLILHFINTHGEKPFVFIFNKYCRNVCMSTYTDNYKYRRQDAEALIKIEKRYFIVSRHSFYIGYIGLSMKQQCQHSPDHSANDYNSYNHDYFCQSVCFSS